MLDEDQAVAQGSLQLQHQQRCCTAEEQGMTSSHRQECAFPGMTPLRSDHGAVAAVEGWFSASLLSSISSSPVFLTRSLLSGDRLWPPSILLPPSLLAHRGTQDLPHHTWTSPRVTGTPHQGHEEPPTFWMLRKVTVSAKSRMMSQSCSHWIPCNLTGVKIKADTQSPCLWAAGMSHSSQPGGGPC